MGNEGFVEKGTGRMKRSWRREGREGRGLEGRHAERG
jgi:hypothetical protein